MRATLTIALANVLVLQVGAQENWLVKAMDPMPSAGNYAPVWLDSGFVMCSVTSLDRPISIKNTLTNTGTSDLFWVPMRDGIPGRAVLFSANLATPMNEGPATFTNGGATICFTRNLSIPRLPFGSRQAPTQLGLFFSDLSQGAWGEPMAFAYNSAEHSVMHPTFSPDGNALYFASDMPGGYGGMDLYVSERTPKGWGKPHNLGPVLNGPQHEVYPVIQNDGSLYFSSDRAGGLGQLDIYHTNNEQGEWGSAQPLPAPINSERNEHGLMLDRTGSQALFGSDRDGADRIWRAERSATLFTDCRPQRADNFCYAFRTYPPKEASKLPVHHYWDLGDGTRIKGSIARHCFDGPGQPIIRSLLVDRKSGKTFMVLDTFEHVMVRRVQAFIDAPDSVATRSSFTLNGSRSHLDDPAVQYHWDLGDGTLIKDERTTHRYKAPGNYLVRLNILGKPDASGQVHSQCSTKRILVLDGHAPPPTTTRQLVFQEVNNGRDFDYTELDHDDLDLAQVDGTDKTFSVKLFASKERVTSDDKRFDEIRKRFDVIEHYDPGTGMYTYSVGRTKDIEELYAIYSALQDLSLVGVEVITLDPERSIDLADLDVLNVEELNNTVVRTSIILFEVGSSSIGETIVLQLEPLTRLMFQHPRLRMMIEAHTDNTGPARYNLGLSQQRARAVHQAFVRRGIDGARITPIGFGQEHPVASNDNEKGRSLNRRVEFRLTLIEQDQALQPIR